MFHREESEIVLGVNLYYKRFWLHIYLLTSKAMLSKPKSIMLSILALFDSIRIFNWRTYCGIDKQGLQVMFDLVLIGTCVATPSSVQRPLFKPRIFNSPHKRVQP
jgi:hypothetical protein